jgi:hypothetical protein
VEACTGRWRLAVALGCLLVVGVGVVVTRPDVPLATLTGDPAGLADVPVVGRALVTSPAARDAPVPLDGPPPCATPHATTANGAGSPPPAPLGQSGSPETPGRSPVGSPAC